MLNVDDIIRCRPASPGRADASPTGRTRLVAYLERRVGLFTVSRLAKQPVVFRRDGELLGTVRTDADGCATFDLNCSDEQWTYSASRPDGTLRSEGTVYAWDPERPTLVFDLDETLIDSRYAGMVFKLEDSSKPKAGAREILHELSKDYGIIYISARARLFRDMTREWLKQYDFPPGPTCYAEDFSAFFSQDKAKYVITSGLQRRGLHIVAGVGDKLADELAFDDCGLPTIIIRPDYAPRRSGTILLSDISELPGTLRRLHLPGAPRP